MVVQIFSTQQVLFHQATFHSASVIYNPSAGCVNLVPEGKQRGFPLLEGFGEQDIGAVQTKGTSCILGEHLTVDFAEESQAHAFKACLQPLADSASDEEMELDSLEDIKQFIGDLIAMTPERLAPVAHIKDSGEADYLSYLMEGINDPEEAASTLAPATPPRQQSVAEAAIPSPASPAAAEQKEDAEDFPGTPPRKRSFVEATPPKVKRTRLTQVAASEVAK
eukprot:CAMPEP_0178431070 /NCGR_PEP_ID=MMETSP0689_2-20121128/31648_1 /TAXON_ID=160604 /ORGANISM="Amphidinium massartii, Strain CS-259" /LENGTH=221 /DNA_ID=CAMNT_0020052951 /DNA_START=82 /DNA_END=747 /DNA_ORIENTATION=-